MHPSSRPLARTALHHWHAAHHARLVERDGWQIPAEYTTMDQEVGTLRAGLGLVDVSAFTKISFQGPGAAALGRALVGDGMVLQPHGVVRSDVGESALACRLTPDHWLLLAFTGNPAGLREWLTVLRQEVPVVESDVTSAYAVFCLVG